jgi:hypothetical protein
MPIPKHQLPKVIQEGAKAGRYLVGISDYNRYLILQVLEDQLPHQRRLFGCFLLVQAGIGHYAEDLAPLVGQQLTADQVTTHLKRRHPEKKWVHVITPDQLAVVPPLPNL